MLIAFLVFAVQDSCAQFTSVYIYNKWPVLGMLISQTTFLIMPSLYLFAKASVYEDFTLGKRSLLHLLPMILINIVLLPIYYIPLLTNPDTDWVTLVSTSSFINIAYISLHVQIFLYYIFIFRLLSRYRKILLENYASPKLDNYKWLLQFFSILLITELVATIKNIMRFGAYEQLYTIFLVLVNILSTGIIFWLVIKAMKNPELFVGVTSDTLLANQFIEKDRQQAGNGITQGLSAYKVIIKKLEDHMLSKAPFMDSSLSLYDLAKQIDVPSRELSIAINHVLNKHFFDYVNEYRINKSMEIIKNSDDDKLTVLEVLYEVGFNSKSSFNTAFKKFTGFTPTEFKKKAARAAA